MAYVYQWYATVNLGTIRFTASSLLRCCKIWNQERKETSQSKTEWTKIYNAQNIVETEQLVEMLKQNGIAAFSQEAGANVAMHGAPGFGIYGVDIFVKTDDAEKAVQLIKEINNQE